jgi:ABC-type lipoprotein release transport system permease subunit
MTTPILRKVWGDLARNKARTLLAVLSIAAGVFALGLAFGALRGHAGLHQQDEARVFSDAVGNAALGTLLDFHYSATGVILWLAIVLVLSALAGLWPALGAARVSVREALAYE